MNVLRTIKFIRELHFLKVPCNCKALNSPDVKCLPSFPFGLECNFSACWFKLLPSDSNHRNVNRPDEEVIWFCVKLYEVLLQPCDSRHVQPARPAASLYVLVPSAASCYPAHMRSRRPDELRVLGAVWGAVSATGVAYLPQGCPTFPVKATAGRTSGMFTLKLFPEKSHSSFTNKARLKNKLAYWSWLLSTKGHKMDRISNKLRVLYSGGSFICK